MPDLKSASEVCTGPSALSHDDRLKIISRIHSMLFWLGETIPQSIKLEGRTVPLHDVVFNYLIKDSHTPDEKKDAEVLAEMLDSKAKEIEHDIKTGNVSRSEACELMNEARSYLRAVDELRTASEKDGEVKRHDLMKRVEDAKRWQKFVKEAR